MVILNANWSRTDLFFVSIPRTGTVALNASIGLRGEWNHWPAKKIRDIVGQDVWDNAYTFSIVRNPYDRIFSWYNYSAQRRLDDIYLNYTFKDWIMAGLPHHWTGNNGTGTMEPFSLCEFLLDYDGTLMVDFVGRFENYKNDCYKICAELGINATIRHLNRSKHGPYMDAYDEDMRAYVFDRFRKDFEIFGYSRN